MLKSYEAVRPIQNKSFSIIIMDDIINLDIMQHLINLDACRMKLFTIQEVFLYCTL